MSSSNAAPTLLARLRAQALTQALGRLSDELMTARVMAGTLARALDRADAANADAHRLAGLLIEALQEPQLLAGTTDHDPDGAAAALTEEEA